MKEGDMTERLNTQHTLPTSWGLEVDYEFVNNNQQLQQHRELAQVGEGFPDAIVLEPNLNGCDLIFILRR